MKLYHLKQQLDVIAYAYQRNLRERGIDKTVRVYNTTDTPRFRSYGIAVEGQKWGDPLFEVVSGEQDDQVYTFTKYATQDSLTPDERPLIAIDRERIFDSYVGKELSDILRQ